MSFQTISEYSKEYYTFSRFVYYLYSLEPCYLKVTHHNNNIYHILNDKENTIPLELQLQKVK